MGFPDGSRPFWLANVWYGSTPRSLACNSLYMIYMQVACVTTNVPMHPFCMHPHKKQPNNLAPPAPKVSHFPHAKMVLCFLASYTKLFFRIYYTYMKVIYFLQLPENGKNNSVKFGWPGYQSWSNPSLSFPSSPNSSSPNYWCRLSCFVLSRDWFHYLLHYHYSKNHAYKPSTAPARPSRLASSPTSLSTSPPLH